MVGKTILHYRIVKEIGKGGMGVVYRADDTKLNRTVAIKALATDLLADEKARTRFLREARAASAIDHPNICTVYEVNEVDEQLFFVMQYVEGPTLKRFINNRPLPLDQALDLALQIVDALAEAHHRHILHRDIKSSNIMLNERNQVKILDFGLAKLVKASAGDAAGGDLTQLGTPFGTASYMSPEQARGEAADARSDIFSLGVVLYEIMNGRLPFKGKTSVDVMHSVIHDPPAAMGDTVPQKIQQIILKALAKEKSNRYQSTDKMLDELRAFVRNHYAERGVVPADRAASLQASKPSKGGGLFSKVSNFVQRTFQSAQPVAKDESSGTPTATPDVTPSIWQSSDKKAIAILPFKNLSGNPENDFYSFSLADSVITELAQLRDLVVRPSSFIVQYQNKDVDPRTVGTQLQVDAVLIGGYIKAGDRFRVTPQLIDVSSGEMLWSEKIDVDAKDIIGVQDTISKKIVEGLRVRTSSREQARLVKANTENAESYEQYLKGRTALYKFITQTLDPNDLKSAIELFEKAVELDPSFALAHSGLGVCYLNYALKGMGGVENYQKARQSFDRALELDSKLVEPRVRMIYIYLLEGNSDVARQEVRRLRQRAPNEASVYSSAAYVYRLSGQYDKALEAWDTFIRISPTDVVFASYNRARIHIYRGEYDKARAEINKGQAFEAHHPLLQVYNAAIDFYSGEVDKATVALEDVLARNPDLHSYKLFLAYCYITKGERDRAFALIDGSVLASSVADQDTAYRLATLFALDSNANKAVEWIERAIAMGNENYPWFVTNPCWKSIQDELRIKAILESLKSKWDELAGPD